MRTIAAAALWLTTGCAAHHANPSPPTTAAPAATATNSDAATEPAAAPPAPPCPASAPAEGTACEGHDLRCTYAPRPACGEIFACYLGAWRRIARGSCGATDACPAAGNEPAGSAPDDGPTPGAPLACVYPNGVVCRWDYLVEQRCSGVRSPTEVRPQLRWLCRPPGPAACVVGSDEGNRCEPDGVACGTTCCGRGSTCVAGRWEVREYPCPP